VEDYLCVFKRFFYIKIIKFNSRYDFRRCHLFTKNVSNQIILLRIDKLGNDEKGLSRAFEGNAGITKNHIN